MGGNINFIKSSTGTFLTNSKKNNLEVNTDNCKTKYISKNPDSKVITNAEFRKCNR
jgi:hypothetical protein